MSERQELAGVGNFPKAFGVLNGLDMARLLLTIDALFATHELDILMGNIGSAAGYDIPRLRAAATAVNEAHTGTSPGRRHRGLPGTLRAAAGGRH